MSADARGDPASTSVVAGGSANPRDGDRSFRDQRATAAHQGSSSRGRPTSPSGEPTGPRRYAKLLIAAAAVGVGVKVVTSGIGALTGPPGPSSFGTWSGPAAPPLPAAAPLRVRVPSLKISAPLIRLGLDGAGAVQVPPMGVPEEAGWYTGNPTPGERGAAIIVGHVDTAHGRAVFYPLGNIQPGADIMVDRADHLAARFRVTSVEVVDKDRFPAARVYGTGRDLDPAGIPELRLITCGGAFDGQHYADNLVVYAELVGSQPLDK